MMDTLPFTARVKQHFRGSKGLENMGQWLHEMHSDLYLDQNKHCDVNDQIHT